jgi:hypothetical protein
MNFIEQIFGVNIDGGNGQFELLLCFAVLLVLTLPIIRRVKKSYVEARGRV